MTLPYNKSYIPVHQPVMVGVCFWDYVYKETANHKVLFLLKSKGHISAEPIAAIKLKKPKP